jgi:hypothetical protein
MYMCWFRNTYKMTLALADSLVQLAGIVKPPSYNHGGGSRSTEMGVRTMCRGDPLRLLA